MAPRQEAPRHVEAVPVDDDEPSAEDTVEDWLGPEGSIGTYTPASQAPESH